MTYYKEGIKDGAIITFAIVAIFVAILFAGTIECILGCLCSFLLGIYVLMMYITNQEEKEELLYKRN